MTDTIVLGGGMVGVSTALALQERGDDCVLMDRRAPGQETSYGNAGLIQAEAAEPHALPCNPFKLAKIAGGARNALAFDLPSLVRQSGAIGRYLWYSRPSRHRQISRVYAELVRGATEAHAPWIRAAGAEDLIRRDGYWHAYRSQRDFAAALSEAETLSQRYGLESRSVDGAGLAAEEPALHRDMAGAILWPNTWRCVAPGDLVASYARLFEARGGRIIRSAAHGAERRGAGWSVAGMSAERVVVALGPWTPEFLRPFGYRIPMVAKRGYHLHFRGNHGLRRALMDVESSIVLSPMNTGLRIATGAELSTGASAMPRQIQVGTRRARELVAMGDQVERSAWSGVRPCLPAMLPIAQEAPCHPGLWIHFGHGHQGFTLGPVTAGRMADAMTGQGKAVESLTLGAPVVAHFLKSG